MSLALGAISEIRPEEPATWRDRIFLTFDFDWAVDEVLNHTADLLEAADVPATFFVTHDTPVLERLRANPRFELGVHPNLNPLLLSSGPGGPAACLEAIVGDAVSRVPEASAVRSHSLVQSSFVLDAFQRAGLSHDCNAFVPHHAGIALRPWRHWNGQVRVPHCWEDDVCLLEGGLAPAAELARRQDFCVFDFHPIHVALNSDGIERYERCRGEGFHWAAVRRERNAKAGVEDELRALLEAARS